jgi:hypothetical protein
MCQTDILKSLKKYPSNEDQSELLLNKAGIGRIKYMF